MIDGFGEPVQLQDGQLNPEQMLADGAITAESYKIISNTIASLRSNGSD